MGASPSLGELKNLSLDVHFAFCPTSLSWPVNSVSLNKGSIAHWGRTALGHGVGSKESGEGTWARGS